MSRKTVGGIAVGLALVWALPAMAEVPFGHADWQPSPTAPVGFAGQGNNWYPGATPPLEWSDSTNGPAKNVRWKVPIPGWTDAQPIVVGSRIVGVYSPHHVVCYDAETGKVLWQDELKVLQVPILGKDRKTVEPVLDPGKAAELQDLFERCLANYRMIFASGAVQRGSGAIAERAPLVEHIVATLTGWRAHFEKTYPDAVAALDQDLKLWAEYRPGNETNYNKLTNDRRKSANAFVQFAQKTTGVSVANNWQGSISDTMAAPVSDGEVVCVAFGFGQYAGYELVSGKRLWAWRDPLAVPGAADHCASPLIWKNLMIVASPGQQRDRIWYRSLRAIDTRTGAIVWETCDARGTSRDPWGASATHGLHMSPCLMHLPDGKGGSRAVVISSNASVVDAETGAALGEFPKEAERWHWGAGFIAAAGDRFYKGYGADNYNPAVAMMPLRFGPDGQLVFGEWVNTELSKPGQGPLALSDKALVSTTGLADPLTGKKLADLGRFSSPTIAGPYLLLIEAFGHNTGPKKHDGSDLLTLSVRVLDIADPAKPQPVGTNLIQARGYTPDITGKYFPKFASDPALRRWGALIPGHVNYQGIGFNFAVDTAGLTAHGNRLYLHSPSWLYCIGEE